MPNILALFIVRIVSQDSRPDTDKEYAIIRNEDDQEHEDYGSPGIERRLSELDGERNFSEAMQDGTHIESNHHQAHSQADRRRSRTRQRTSLERYRARSPASSLDLPSEFGNIGASVSELPHGGMTHDLEDISEDTRTRPASIAGGSSEEQRLAANISNSTNQNDPERIVDLIKKGDFWLMFFTVSLCEWNIT